MDRDYFLNCADENLPLLHEKSIRINEEKRLKTGDEILLDLKNHFVGYFSFALKIADEFIDSPVRLKILFYETERELTDDFDQCNGTLSSAWLQQEILYVDFPETIRLKRRYACRYIRVIAENAPKTVLLTDFSFTAVTSADENALSPIVCQDEMLAKIDAVATNTLKNCMQRVFEDGPKRDRRLWIGDLRLEALANAYTFKNQALVKRCLYLFAATDRNKDGFINSCLYEYPYFQSAQCYLVDYALLYVVSVCDYYEQTNDRETLEYLLPVCIEQFDRFADCLDENGEYVRREYWSEFIDWQPALTAKKVAMHGVYLYALRAFIRALKNIGNPLYATYQSVYEEAKRVCRTHFYSEKETCFTDAGQKSVHAQVWMILGGVCEQEEARRLLETALLSPAFIKPFTPYMQHYVLEAMLSFGMKREAKEYLTEYWGKMIEDGADTFYEVFVPDQPDFSPYNDRMLNSACHAWSCTPTYFIRKYFNE